MGIMDLFQKVDINEELRKFRAEDRATLLDVRTREEYATGHIPRSRNLPLDQIAKAESSIPEKDMPVYVYCASGKRSKQAVDKLQKMGYTNVVNIGGIENYSGKVERSSGGRNRAPNSMKSSALNAQKKEPWNKNLPKMR